MTNEQMINQCKANALTLVRIFRETEKMNDAGLKMLDEVSAWLATPECNFLQNGFLGDAPKAADKALLQDLWKSYAASK
jgi:hypothetical protein